ncbi:MAG: MogA/MoaB family molybdenum cofactor biosynthesis protein [Desulfovibrionaceae bacterium]|nr:MogA/MoaB family molybdenum cofactor biosynthesis protein [Desulfovibrionaceae bacterium]
MQITLPDPQSPPAVLQDFELSLRCPELRPGQNLFLLPEKNPSAPQPQALIPRPFFLPGLAGNPLAAGMLLLDGDRPLFSVDLRLEMPVGGQDSALPCIRISALAALKPGEYRLAALRTGPALAWITVSDKGSLGERLDESGPAIHETIRKALALRCASGYLVPDEIFRLRALAADLALVQGYDLVIASGGTGLALRDQTPEALLPLLEKRLPGFEQAMIQASMRKTPHGAISRAICGTVGQSLLLTLPGSPKAVRENLEAVLPALGHALGKLQGNREDCG